MAQVNQLQPGHFYGPEAMRPVIDPIVGHFYHSEDIGYIYRGDGEQWIRAWSPADIRFNQPFPGFGEANAVLVPADKWFRLVYGVIRLQASGLNSAQVSYRVEEEPGTYENVGTLPSQVSATPRDQMFFFLVPGNRRYYMAAGGLAGVLEQVQAYHYADF